MTKESSIDKQIINLRNMYIKEKEKGEVEIPLENISMWGFSMKLPVGLIEMNEEIKKVIFPMYMRPTIVKIDENKKCRFTFSKIIIDEESGENNLLEKIYKTFNECGKQIIVYDKDVLQAVNVEIGWVEYKMLCLDGSLYGITYIFFTKTECIIGGFQCEFSLYDKWKFVIIELLKHIKVMEGDIGIYG